MVRLLYQCALLAAYSLVPVTADGTYRSRPDLSPPHINVTIPPSGRTESGYLFVAPYVDTNQIANFEGPQIGAYILTEVGDLVWSGFSYFSGSFTHFQAARWKGKDILFAFQGGHTGRPGHEHGHHTFRDAKYDVVKVLHAGNHALADGHEFNIIDEKTALINIYHPVQIDLTPYGGKKSQTWIVEARFQELDIETGAVLFDWQGLNHISPDESVLPLTSGAVGTGYRSSSAWDYIHLNSVTKGKDGHYTFSGRHASTIYKINGTDGSVIWRLGGKKSDFKLGEGVVFGGQHHARYLPGGNETSELLSLFDNQVYVPGVPHNPHPVSRGKYIRLDHVAKTATLEQVFLPPNNSVYSFSQGSLQTLPNGNVLIGWGSGGQVTEFTPKGEPIYHAFLIDGVWQKEVQNYRAFRYNWTGISSETIAVFAESVGKNDVVVYVSWNGDTETRSWRFGWAEVGEKNGKKVSVKKTKEVERRGFETKLKIASATGKVEGVYVEAVSAKGKVLGVSEKVETVKAFWINENAAKEGDDQILLNGSEEL